MRWFKTIYKNENFDNKPTFSFIIIDVYQKTHAIKDGSYDPIALQANMNADIIGTPVIMDFNKSFNNELIKIETENEFELYPKTVR